jgi:uncharacterized membrane protein
MLPDKFETLRIETFSDGVFTIAITLLIVEIKVPHNVSPGGLSRALLNPWPSYLALLTTCCTIGRMWVNHQRLFTVIRAADETLSAINLLLLLAIAWFSFRRLCLRPISIALTNVWRSSGDRDHLHLLWRYGVRKGHVPHT